MVSRSIVFVLPFLLNIGLVLISFAKADMQCFLVKENDQIIKQEGNCGLRRPPCSTFKIAISLMSYNEGLLADKNSPEFPFKEGYVDWISRWKQTQTPTTWMKNSCVWYSQILTQKLGMLKFKDYVTKFNYGNQDVSGDEGKNNGLTNAWLSSSLKISPKEQLQFLQKLLDNKLPVSPKSQEITRNILFIEELPGGWKLFGKTGSGFLPSEERKQELDCQIGWFVGWLQKDNRTLIFVHYIEKEDKQGIPPSAQAKEGAKEKLMHVIQSHKKKYP